jgi:hypothetical protein
MSCSFNMFFRVKFESAKSYLRHVSWFLFKSYCNAHVSKSMEYATLYHKSAILSIVLGYNIKFLSFSWFSVLHRNTYKHHIFDDTSILFNKIF